MKQIKIRVEDELYEQLEAISKDLYTTVTDIVKRATVEYVKRITVRDDWWSAPLTDAEEAEIAARQKPKS